MFCTWTDIWVLGGRMEVFLLVVLLFLMKRAGRRVASATVGAVRESIARQEEYRELLKRSGVDYDERFLW